MNSAEKEIAILSGDTDTKDWLTSNGLLESRSTDYTVEVVSDWNRPGSEAYVLDFVIQQSNSTTETTDRYIAKACIKPPCTDSMNEWLKRRQVLGAAGVRTPRLYVVRQAVLIEEHVPYDVQTAFNAVTVEEQRRVIAKIFDTYDRMRKAGFDPRPLHDLRSHGNDVVVVDFGEDLGGQRMENVDLSYDRKAFLQATLSKKALSILE